MRTGTTTTTGILVTKRYSGETTDVNPLQTLDIQQTSNNGDHVHPTPYHLLVDESLAYQGTYESYGGNPTAVDTYTQTGVHFSRPAEVHDLGPSTTDAYNICLDKLFDKVRGNLDLAVDIAEMNQTKRMLTTLEGSNLSAIADLWKAMQKRGILQSFSDYASSLKYESDRARGYRNWVLVNGLRNELRAAKLALFTSADLWLTWQYGVRPLLQDIHDTCSLLTEKIAPGASYIEVGKSIKYPVSVVRHGGMQPYTGNGDETVTFNKGSKVGCKIRLKVTIPTDESQLAKFTSLNPFSILWEATPYTFVSDWFFDVGSYIRNIESMYLYRGVISEIQLTTINACTASVNLEIRTELSEGRYYDMKLKAYRRYIRIDRSLPNFLPVPSRPRINTNLGSSRLLSAAALLIQLLK